MTELQQLFCFNFVISSFLGFIHSIMCATDNRDQQIQRHNYDKYCEQKIEELPRTVLVASVEIN